MKIRLRRCLIVLCVLGTLPNQGFCLQNEIAAKVTGSAPFEQVMRLSVELDRPLRSGKDKPGDVISAHSRTKVILQNGVRIDSRAVLVGRVLDVVSRHEGRPSMVLVAFDSLQPHGDLPRSIHATILAIRPAPDFLHANNHDSPLDRSSIGVGPEAGASQNGPAQEILTTGTTVAEQAAALGRANSSVARAGRIRVQRSGVPGVDLRSDLEGMAAGEFTSKSGDVYVPAGTIMTVLVAVSAPQPRAQ